MSCRIHQALLNRIEQVREVHTITRGLIDSILKSIDTSLRYLLQDQGAGQTYAPLGRQPAAAPEGRQLLDARA